MVNSIFSSGTRCVISHKGQRTLATLRAICMGIPVVKPEWVGYPLFLLSRDCQKAKNTKNTVQNKGKKTKNGPERKARLSIRGTRNRFGTNFQIFQKNRRCFFSRSSSL